MFFAVYANANGLETFYYANDKTIDLIKIENKVVIRVADVNENIDDIFSRHELLPKGLTKKVMKLKNYKFIEYKGSKNDCDILLENSKNISDFSYISKKYITSNNIEVGLTDEILVVFHDKIKEKDIESLYLQYGVELVERSTYDLIRVPKNGNVLEIANSIHESNDVKFAEPNFLCDIEYHGDTYFDAYLQFQMDNYGYNGGTVDADVDASLAWGISTGSSNIVVAVIDDGIKAHVDLPSSKLTILPGSNFGADAPSGDPSPLSVNHHGIACAGIIGAQHNTLGIRGIAPGCKIMPVRMGPYPSSNTALISLVVNVITFAYQNGADVISCSWGGFPLSGSIEQAIENATTLGRNGDGTVVCFSAGNNGNDEEIGSPARYCNGIAGALCIGATTKNDTLAGYSQAGDLDLFPEYCWRVTVAAPSSDYVPNGNVYTTDRAGTFGYNPASTVYTPNWGSNYADFTGLFGGTSAACPLVAGIAALILSVDSTLTASEVETCITSSAEKLSGFTFESSGTHTGMNNEIGYGRVNAYAALQAAQSANKMVSLAKNVNTTVTPSIAITPNPANPSTTLNYTLVNSGNVKINIYSVSGQKVATLVDGFMTTGKHAVVFDGSDMASGVYFYQFQTEGFATSGKMLLVK